MHLQIGCRLELRCEDATPFLALVHPHPSLREDVLGAERTLVEPDRSYEVLTDSGGNRWSRWVAPPGLSRFQFSASVSRPDRTDLVVPTAPQCPVRQLPIDTYRYLNASTYCDTAALMTLAWNTFDNRRIGWALVQDICDWVHGKIRFDYQAVRAEKTASHTLDDGAGVCRDFAHLAITLCRCLNIPARYCTGYLGYTGIAKGEAPVDFSAWFEVFLGDRWYVFDARHNIPRCGRVLIGRGRDAGDVPFLRSFGPHDLLAMEVITEAITAPDPHPSNPVPEATSGSAASVVL
ncbi:MAG: transglutaminase family protein [Cyanobacteriota bacterium]|nr:transglutaminase family protein [Cyanobacteriota bacterium]